MVEIDPITGLPKELGVWEDIVKENQQIVISVERKKFRKEYTIIEGIDTKQIDVKELAKKLKNKFACGGTSKEGKIELQGNHKQEVADYLIDKLQYPAETIEVK